MIKKLNCILLVDDNESDNYIHKRIIQIAGIADHIEIAEHGQEAIDLLNANKCEKPDCSVSHPDLIFLDINMPVMNGWEFLEEYRQFADFQKGEVVIKMLTTSLNPSDITKTQQVLGDDCLLFKPLTLEIINAIMQKHFPGYL